MATKFSMIVVITSCAPKYALRKPGIAPQRNPVTTQPSRTRIIPRGPRNPRDTPSQAAVMAPIKNWPSPPMLKSPTRKATATARPVKIRGVAFSRVRPSSVGPPNAPRRSAPKAVSGLSPVASMMIAPIRKEIAMAIRGNTRAPTASPSHRRNTGPPPSPPWSRVARSSLICGRSRGGLLLGASSGHQETELLVAGVGADLADDLARVDDDYAVGEGADLFELEGD